MTGPLAPVAPETPADGVWRLEDGHGIIAESGGPATLLVPGESVLLLAVDLPLPSRAKRIAALPFAIEDRIADPVDAVHIALGQEIAAGQYLVGVVRHDRMQQWVEAAEAAGLAHAAILPDALALPVPETGNWNIEARGARVLVRNSDGTGFAAPRAMIAAIWEKAGRPAIHNLGREPVGELPQDYLADDPVAGEQRLAAPALDLRQGVYARRGGRSNWRKRLGWIVAAGIAAHVVISAADTVMLRVIAERRADDLRATVAQVAPGTSISGDLRSGIADMLPVAGPAGSAFVPQLTRASRALAPLDGTITTRAMRFEGNALVIDLEPGEAGLIERVQGALRSAGVEGQVALAPDGAVRVTVPA